MLDFISFEMYLLVMGITGLIFGIIVGFIKDKIKKPKKINETQKELKDIIFVFLGFCIFMPLAIISIVVFFSLGINTESLTVSSLSMIAIAVFVSFFLWIATICINKGTKNAIN